MAFDPLSRSTRTVRTSLLIFCAASLSIHLFEIAPASLPLLGTEIPLPELFLPFVTGIGILYLAISFLVYAADDVTNVKSARQLALQGQRLLEEGQRIEDKVASLTDELYEAQSTAYVDGHGLLKYRHSNGRAQVAVIENELSRATSQIASLTARKIDIEVEQASKWKILRNMRFYGLEIGVPVVTLFLVVLGYRNQLGWLKTIIGISPSD